MKFLTAEVTNTPQNNPKSYQDDPPTPWLKQESPTTNHPQLLTHSLTRVTTSLAQTLASLTRQTKISTCQRKDNVYWKRAPVLKR